MNKKIVQDPTSFLNPHSSPLSLLSLILFHHLSLPRSLMLVSSLLPQDGCTPLIRAAAKGKTETAAMLIERGADLEAKDNVRTRHPWWSFIILFP